MQKTCSGSSVSLPFELSIDQEAETAVVAYMKNCQPVMINDETVRSYIINFASDSSENVLSLFLSPIKGQELAPLQIACYHMLVKQHNDVN